MPVWISYVCRSRAREQKTRERKRAAHLRDLARQDLVNSPRRMRAVVPDVLGERPTALRQEGIRIGRNARVGGTGRGGIAEAVRSRCIKDVIKDILGIESRHVCGRIGERNRCGEGTERLVETAGGETVSRTSSAIVEEFQESTHSAKVDV
jgi:hypothetical protein